MSQLRGGPPPIIQTTVAISKGSSGGGLFNAEGELVGITTFYLKDRDQPELALPVGSREADRNRSNLTRPQNRLKKIFLSLLSLNQFDIP